MQAGFLVASRNCLSAFWSQLCAQATKLQQQGTPDNSLASVLIYMLSMVSGEKLNFFGAEKQSFYGGKY
jgi:hypothetical protein